MEWRPAFYRLQQRLALTNREVRTLAVLLTLMAAGLVLRQIRHGLVPYDAAYYDAYFAELDTVSQVTPSHPAPSPLLRPDSAGAPSGTIASTEPEQENPAGPISINRASAAELEQLPRIGPRTADRIIAFREANGPFRRVEDLLQIRGIGEKTLEGLRPHVVVD